jgi:hypothetical protein
MPKITFTIETEATIKRLDLDETDHYDPVDLNLGVGNADLASGYGGVAILELRGDQGQTAKFKITQRVGQADVILAQRNSIRITSPKGRALNYVPFIVQ